MTHHQNVRDQVSKEVVFRQTRQGAEEAVQEEGRDADEQEQVVQEVDRVRVDVQFGNFYVDLK